MFLSFDRAYYAAWLSSPSSSSAASAASAISSSVYPMENQGTISTTSEVLIGLVIGLALVIARDYSDGLWHSNPTGISESPIRSPSLARLTRLGHLDRGFKASLLPRISQRCYTWYKGGKKGHAGRGFYWTSLDFRSLLLDSWSFYAQALNSSTRRISGFSSQGGGQILEDLPWPRLDSFRTFNIGGHWRYHKRIRWKNSRN